MSVLSGFLLCHAKACGLFGPLTLSDHKMAANIAKYRVLM